MALDLLRGQSASSPPDEGRYAPRAPSAEEWAQATPHAAPAGIDVIVPIYRGRDETLLALHRVLTAKTEIGFRLVVVDDSSPDPALKTAVAELHARGLLVRLVNWRNLGFCASVNRGMRLAGGRDVVLLNSDTEVFDGWLDRLHAVASADAATGTVTPLSNAATILSYPFFLKDDHQRLELSSAELDALAARLDQPPVEIPTGIGFCMYIKGDCLKDVGLFDSFHFGKGYAEENDFCRRALARGWTNVAAANVFVWHWGGRSFGARKARLLAKALRTLGRLHPTYHATVADYISRDPMAPVRAALDLERVRRAAGRPVLIDARLAEREGLGEPHRSVMLREQGRGAAWTIAAPAAPLTPNLPPFDPEGDPDGARAVVEALCVSEIRLSREHAHEGRVRALESLAARLGLSCRSH